MVPILNLYGLYFAFLDLFDLAALDFGIIEVFSTLKRIDMLVYVSQMDLQRNLISNVTSDDSVFDVFVESSAWVNSSKSRST